MYYVASKNYQLILKTATLSLIFQIISHSQELGVFSISSLVPLQNVENKIIFFSQSTKREHVKNNYCVLYV